MSIFEIFDKSNCYIYLKASHGQSLVSVMLSLKQRDTPIRLQIKRSKPFYLSTMTPLVINHVTNLVDLAKKANP